MASCPQCQAPYEAATHRFCPSCGFPVGEVMQRPEDPLIGKSLPGGYVLLELIGVGGMGRVYRAEQKALGRTVAVKVIHAHLHGEEGAAARFITEARAASRLNHPNVVAVIDFGRTAAAEGNLLYLVMEFLRGHDLARIAYEEGPLPFARIVDVLKQTLGALDEAHHLGIIHRDVKPENIVLEPTRGGGDFVKVVDFGLAKLRPDMLSGITASGKKGITSPGIVCGTPDYMSPEQGRGDELDARSDLYALGVIMYQLLTGQLPFEAASPTQVVLMHLQQAPPDPRKVAPARRIPEGFAEVCLKALEKDRTRRFSDANDFSRALDSALRHISGAPTTVRLPRSVVCTVCKSEVPATQKFCGECGSRVTPPAPVNQVPTLPPPLQDVVPSSPTRSPSTQIPAPTSPAAIAPRTALPLLGRQDDLSWLQDRRREAANEVRGARIVGEVGVGKTRLLQEFLHRARAERDFIVEVWPDPTWADVGYYGLRDAIVKLTGITQTTDLSRLPIEGLHRTEILCGLEEVILRPFATRLSPEARRYAAVAALRWSIEYAANGGKRAPRRIILSLDDLPRLDGATRHAISDFLGEPPQAPLLVLATHTPGFDAGWPAGRSLARVVAGLPVAVATTALRGLPARATGSATEQLQEAGARGVMPLYLDQLVRLASEGGGPAPSRVADLIVLRVERLGADARRVLQAAAVLGDDVQPTELSPLLPDGTDIPTSLAICEAAGMLESSNDGLRFAHPLFREVAAATLPAGARRELHAKAAEIYSQQNAPIEVRALHAFYAHNAFEALLLLDQVADKCAQRADDEGAIIALRRCLELARRALFRGDVDEPEHAVVMFSRKLGVALARAGYLTDAEGILREALDLAGPADTDRARLLEGLARVARARERHPEATALLREAIVTAGRSGARDLLATLEELELQWRAAS